MYGPLRGDVQLRILVFQITFSTADRLERSGKSVVPIGPPSFALPIPHRPIHLALARIPPMTTTDNLDWIYLHYFKETFDKLGLEIYESSKGQIKFKNQVLRLQLLGDRGLVETDISPLHGEEQFRGIEMYNSLLTLRDYQNKLTETEKRRILGTRLDFNSQIHKRCFWRRILTD